MAALGYSKDDVQKIIDGCEDPQEKRKIVKEIRNTDPELANLEVKLISGTITVGFVILSLAIKISLGKYLNKHFS